ncbi:MAG: ribulose-phosphate 3-epimerase [Candidatus Omnitrophica bacterium]|jgi:ribulose-phosphate 3-epimerase|nr:ribulose-phosphate 3-epimerase [Candidatus Omnitrophota bacterium]
MKIVPALLTDKPEDLERMIRQAEGFCGLVQVDIMDGKFVPSKSISAADLAKIKTGLELEIHIMVEDPSSYIVPFKNAGASRIVFHYESKEDPAAVIKGIRAQGMQAGIAINPETPVSKVEPYFKDIDILLFLSVNPGYYGSKFIPGVCDKARSLKARKDRPVIAMDGGLKSDNILVIRDAGVDLACVGSGVYGRGDPAQNYRALTEKIA